MQSPIPLRGKDGKYHFIYRTHNLINGKEYTGKHSTDDLDDGYYGSGNLIKSAVTKYGIENFVVEFLNFFETEQDASQEELNIVNEDYIYREDTYNLMLGGLCNFTNRVTVKDKYGNTMSVAVDDPRYLSGELVHVSTGLIVVKDKNGNKLTVTKDDPRYLSGKLIGIAKGNKNPGQHKGKVVVKDSTGNIFQISNNDPRYLSGELVAHSKGRKYSSNRKYKLKVCPHCGKKGKGPNMPRYHFDNCKSK